MTFAQSIVEWHEFYISLITAAATLLGLLFIGISLNPSRMQSESDYRSTALQTYTSFVIALLISFIFIIPDQSTVGVALPLLIFGISGLLQTIQNTRSAMHSQIHVWPFSRIVSRFGLPIIAFVGLIIIAITLFSAQIEGLTWLVPVMLVLIGSSCSNAWQLLIHSAKAE